MQIDKKDLWPKQGKLKKALLILAVVAGGALGMVLLEEQTGWKAGSKIPFLIALSCLAIWFHKSDKEKKETNTPS